MRTRTKTIIFSTLAMGAVLQPFGLAIAQTQAQSRPTANRAAQEAACSGDATQFCGPMIPDEQKIAACLRANRDKISQACRAMLN